MTHDKNHRQLLPFVSGRSAAWLARLPWEQEVVGSNPTAPTIDQQKALEYSSKAFFVCIFILIFGVLILFQVNF